MAEKNKRKNLTNEKPKGILNIDVYKRQAEEIFPQLEKLNTYPEVKQNGKSKIK